MFIMIGFNPQRGLGVFETAVVDPLQGQCLCFNPQRGLGVFETMALLKAVGRWTSKQFQSPKGIRSL
jgi:hypothetical protein